MYLVLKFFQHVTVPVLGGQSYWFSIVLLTLAVRIVLIPLTVKQVRSTRAMQEIAPKMKQIQAKYKNDKQRMNEEMMALYKEHGVNPLAGCWPLLAQLPFFFALYRVIYSHKLAGETNILSGKNFFGVSLDQRWGQLHGWDKLLSASGITILLLIIGMAVTTYISQRQLMSKQAQQVNPQQATMMKLMPLFFVFISINFPLAVIIYWVTTNLWTMGQQWVLLRNAPQPAAAGGPASAGGRGGSSRAAKPSPSGSPSAAPALAPDGDGEERKGLGALGLFRGLLKPPEANEGAAPAGSAEKNGRVPPRDADTKQPPAQKRQAGQRGAGSPQAGKQGSGGGARRRSGGRSSGKGKASGPRRGKR
jgi:YidC/Oxa1 family membrane protein insertase